MAEKWKPVVGHESLYECSDMGRIRSMDGGAVVEPFLHHGRMATFGLRMADGSRRFVSAALVIAKAWVKNTHNSQRVHVKNGDPMDLRAENIEWRVKAKKAGKEQRRRGRPRKAEAPEAPLSQPELALHELMAPYRASLQGAAGSERAVDERAAVMSEVARRNRGAVDDIELLLSLPPGDRIAIVAKLPEQMTKEIRRRYISRHGLGTGGNFALGVLKRKCKAKHAIKEILAASAAHGRLSMATVDRERAERMADAMFGTADAVCEGEREVIKQVADEVSEAMSPEPPDDWGYTE